MQKHLSPLRYPGGKAAIAGLLKDVLALNGKLGSRYYEPYAGGAGAALSLLRNNAVSEVHINDADPRIVSFWRSILRDTERFVEKIQSVDLSMAEWYRQKEVCENPRAYSRFEVGFAAFYMNRCNRSGVLSGAGPIGGYTQSGTWKIDARFNRDELVQRVLSIASMKRRIFVYDSDAIEFLKTQLPKGPERQGVFVYLDPPYVVKGQRLYLNSYSKSDHASIATYLLYQKVLAWTLSYDDSEIVRWLYRAAHVHDLPIRYSLQSRRTATELFIAPEYVVLPFQLSASRAC